MNFLWHRDGIYYVFQPAGWKKACQLTPIKPIRLALVCAFNTAKALHDKDTQHKHLCLPRFKQFLETHLQKPSHKLAATQRRTMVGQFLVLLTEAMHHLTVANQDTIQQVRAHGISVCSIEPWKAQSRGQEKNGGQTIVCSC